MTRLSLFNSPLLLGFDHFERALDRISKASSDGYPPYNIEQTDDNKLKITCRSGVFYGRPARFRGGQSTDHSR